MRVAFLILSVLIFVACGDSVERVVVHRSSCEVCHKPLDEEGSPHGIEVAHPWFPISCTGCHGGNAHICDGNLGEQNGEKTCDGTWIYDREQAHVSPGDGPVYLRNLPSAELDNVDQDYLQFINPGDLRVMERTCGPCHPAAVTAVRNSTMMHTSGEITVARYRAMMQDTPHGIFGAANLVDPNKDPNNACGVSELTLYDPEPIVPLNGSSGFGVPTVGEAQDQYMVKSCMRCHLNDFGENRFQGDFRSSGCTACHMTYSNDGLSRSKDPWVSKQTVPHPTRHEMTTAPPSEQCTHCHYRGGRIGISFQGYRESGGAGLNPKKPIVLGLALHGHDANYYLTDENADNLWDETPPDIHMEKGMHCVDCHTRKDIHGDGHLYADTQCAVSTRCEDCHGSVRERAELDEARPHITKEGETFILTTKLGGIRLQIPQTKDVVTEGHPRYSPNAALAMGIHNGVSHTDKMECYTCHAGWMPNCYGCHVDMDLTKEKAYQTTGRVTAGKPTGKRRWVVLNDLVLMKNSEGKIAPSMPAERFFMSLFELDVDASALAGEDVKVPIYMTKPRTYVFPDGRVIAGFGQRAFNPHTTRKRSQFMACDRCHTVGDPANPDNKVLLDITHGFGSKRFPQEGCDVTNDDESCDPATDWTIYYLDAIQTPAGLPLVVVGHPDPFESRPLSLDEIAAMRAIIVPANPPYKTQIPADAATNPNWPFAQEMEPELTRRVQ